MVAESFAPATNSSLLPPSMMVWLAPVFPNTVSAPVGPPAIVLAVFAELMTGGRPVDEISIGAKAVEDHGGIVRDNAGSAVPAMTVSVPFETTTLEELPKVVLAPPTKNVLAPVPPVTVPVPAADEQCPAPLPAATLYVEPGHQPRRIGPVTKCDVVGSGTCRAGYGDIAVAADEILRAEDGEAAAIRAVHRIGVAGGTQTTPPAAETASSFVSPAIGAGVRSRHNLEH